MDEKTPRGLQSMCDAPHNRSIRLELRNGSTILVRWDFRDVPQPWDSARRKRIWGWCHRDSREPIDGDEIVGWIEADEIL
jgi:hypothetical protein